MLPSNMRASKRLAVLLERDDAWCEELDEIMSPV